MAMLSIQQQLVGIISLLLLLLPPPSAAAGAGAGSAPSPVISSTCAAVTKTPLPTHYDYCVRTLSSAPSAAAATDARGLLAAAANLTAASAVSTLAVLNNLVVALQYCVAEYELMRRSAAGAVDDLLHGVDPKKDLDVVSKLKTSSFQPAMCDLAFMESNTDKDPFLAENEENQRMARLAYNIAEVLRT